KRAYKLLYRQGLTLQTALADMRAMDAPELTTMIEFIEQSERGIIR
ncbi:MAG: acyl-[acyl-carrier-protein]--UDP-N-acetylglucosamine O-acyltransferase, partial [Idiomarina sp.]|nr:acyl-[acyl-carrier-protein]--UDP-N-acetylglucosamine O-acyltransferase [Idiomarina sp.]